MNEPHRILLAEDEEIIAIIISDLLGAQGYAVTVCADGHTAWDTLRSARMPYDVILLDRVMPGMDGMELLGRIKADPALAHIPVIMETAQGDKESIREGLAQGAYYYLTKPFQAEVLLAVVQAALEHAREYQALVAGLRRAEGLITLLHQGEFHIRDLDEARFLANVLAQACPEPERAIQGLQEILVNAIEHGNLGITYEEKGRLLLEGTWQDEVERRLDLPEYRSRWVSVIFERHAEGLCFRIQDQGLGFDWVQYLDFSPERAFDLHGRGIAMARKLSFDRIAYHGNGNTVEVAIDIPPPS